MTTFLGRPAWRIETAELRVTILECGGHVAEILHKPSGAVNPLWIQNVPTIDADQFDFEVHGPLYGFDGEAKLISGLAGHNLCFPFWGAPSKTEQAAGMTAHGESNIVRWTEVDRSAHSLHLAAHLPEASIHFERVLTCEGGAIYFEEMARNLSAWDRPVAWCEHVTLGPPFLDSVSTGFHASLTRGFRTSADPAQEFLWPEGHGEFPSNLTRFSSRRHSDLVNSFLVDPAREHGHFAAWNSGQKLLIAYVFRRCDFRWMNVWECNDDRRQTRGMEFSTTPIEGTLRQLVSSRPIWDVPVYEWLPARGEIRKEYTVFLSGIQDSFPGVAEVHVTPDGVNALDRLGNTLTMPRRPDGAKGC